MEELLLINPHHRGTRKRKAHRKPVRAKAAYRRNPAPRRAAAPKRRRTYRRNPAPLMSVAPRRRRRTYRRNPAPLHAHRRSHRRHYRRNPSARVGVMSMVVHAFQGAAGATLVNTLTNMLPLPAVMTTGSMVYVTRGLMAVLLGTFGRKFLPSGMAHRMAMGSLTVTAHDALVNVIGPMMPSLGLAGMGEYIHRPGMGGMGFYAGGQAVQPGMLPGDQPAPMGQTTGFGEYVHSGMGEMGW